MDKMKLEVEKVDDGFGWWKRRMSNQRLTIKYDISYSSSSLMSSNTHHLYTTRFLNYDYCGFP